MRFVTSSRIRSLAAPLLAVLIVAVYGFGADEYTTYVLTLAALSAMCAVGLDVLMGFGGYVSLAQGAMYGVGAYTTAVLSAEHGWSSWTSLLASVTVATGVSGVLAALLFRTRGLYFAIVTLGVGVAATGMFITASGITGGPAGFVGIPGFSPLFGWQPQSSQDRLALVLLLLAIVYVLAWFFVGSTVGRRSVGVREDEVLARSLGIRPGMPRLLAFVFAASAAAAAGSYFATYSNFISPS